jgi:low affinity Fe/Cu permease
MRLRLPAASIPAMPPIQKSPAGQASEDSRPAANAFDRFAEASSRFVSRGAFFAISLLLVLIWIPTIALFESVDTWQLVMNTVVSVLAFLLIALLQNSERRYDAALHHKIDAVLTGIADLMDHLEEEDPERARRHVDRLRTSVRIERKL